MTRKTKRPTKTPTGLPVMRVLRDRAWKKMSIWVRRQGADLFHETNSCFTCEKTFPIKELQAGHFLHNKLDFDPRNLKPQCISCNNYHDGHRILYTIKLVKMHGMEWVDRLRHDADVKGNNYTRIELNEVIQKYV